MQVQPGELVQVRCLIDRPEVLQEMLLAVELAGVTPLLELISPAYLEKLVAGADPAYLENGDKYRQGWAGQYNRILILQGEPPRFKAMPVERLNLWRQAQNRPGQLEEDRRLPFLLVAIPTGGMAERLSLSLEKSITFLAPLSPPVLPSYRPKSEAYYQRPRAAAK